MTLMGTATRLGAALPTSPLGRWQPPPQMPGWGGGCPCQGAAGVRVLLPPHSCHRAHVLLPEHSWVPWCQAGAVPGSPAAQGLHGDGSTLPAVIHHPAKPHRSLMLPAAQPGTVLPAQAPHAVPCSHRGCQASPWGCQQGSSLPVIISKCFFSARCLSSHGTRGDMAAHRGPGAVGL